MTPNEAPDYDEPDSDEEMVKGLSPDKKLSQGVDLNKEKIEKPKS